MIDTVPKPDANLAEFLMARARHTSDDRLAAASLGGLVVGTAVALWHGPAWAIILAVATCFFAFGVWGIADRELAERSGSTRAIIISLRLVRVVTTALGFGAIAFILLVALGVALGTIIS